MTSGAGTKEARRAPKEVGRAPKDAGGPPSYATLANTLVLYIGLICPSNNGGMGEHEYSEGVMRGKYII